MPQNFYRPTSGKSLNWYVRLIPPSSLKGLPNVKEFRRSTGTADRRRARVVGTRLIAEQLAAWSALEAKQRPTPSTQVLTPQLVEHICASRLYQWMMVDDAGRYHGEGHTEKSQQELELLCNITDQAMRSVLARGRASDQWEEALENLDFWCVQMGCPVERTDPLYTELVRRFAAVEREGVANLSLRNRGEHVPTPAVPHGVGPRLSSLLPHFQNHKAKQASRKHLSTTSKIWLRLQEYLGDVPVASVKPSHLYAFMEARMNAKERPWSMGYTHGLVKRTLKEVFSIARTQGLLDGPNPVDDLHVLPALSQAEERARTKPRHPFTDKQLSQLFKSAWYAAKSTQWKGRMATDLGARYWVPLVCMLHGTRVREALQLVVSDIEASGAVRTMHLQEEIDEGSSQLGEGLKRSVKNAATARVVPLHPKLVELGFLSFVEQRKAAEGANALLFPSSMPTPGGKTPILGRAYEQAFLRHVRDGLAFGRGYGSHSFRHQLEDRLRDAQRPGKEWPAGLSQAYTGRKSLRQQDRGVVEAEGSERAYGRGHSPESLLRYIRTLSFDRVALPRPYDQWLRES